MDNRKKGMIGIILSCLIILWTGCQVGRTSVTTGMSDQAFLAFTADRSCTVEVTVDGKTHFNAAVSPESVHQVKGVMYAIKPGRRLVVVKEGDKTVYRKEIFLSSQETKTIQLP